MSHITTKMVKSKGDTRRKVYVARWKEGTKKKEKIFDRKRDATKFLETAGTDPARELDIYGSDKTYVEVAREYRLSLIEPTDGSDPIGEQTNRTYKRYLTYSAFVLQKHRIGEVNDEWMRNVRDYCVMNTNSTRAASEAFRLCKAVMSYAEEQSLIKGAPGQKLKVVTSRSNKMQERIRKTDQVFTTDEVRSLLRAADALAQDKQKQRRKAWVAYRALAYFLAYTGARISEARGFPRVGFLHNQNLISIRQKATESGEIEYPKTRDGIRDIPLVPELVTPMQEAMRAHDRNLVFSTRNGDPLELRNLYNRMWKPLLAKANEMAADEENELVPVRELGFHALRHSYASRLIAANVDLKRLQVWMGHHDPAYTVKQYGHLMEDRAADAALMEKIAV
ncbi:site-specific integrase [Ruegeria sp. A3M17]|uniref:tyrosine-type recombinase/integrase n=1 Tax=Ruegeria sp. A3M17 TaxID=2267229 RepID=UPI001314E379|nr:site-specific integrase [Ruegeria sp. A3M17]